MHPGWIKVRAPGGDVFDRVSRLLSQHGLKTVCFEAACPNIRHCFDQETATFLILGAVCTRTCGFCAVKPGRPEAPDDSEPFRVARAAEALGLKYAVVTSVTRDDLADGGATLFAETVACLKELNPAVRVEVLIPDFQGSRAALETVLASPVDVLAHNVETVPSLYPAVRAGADYGRSLRLLKVAKGLDAHVLTKSSLMLGLGETAEEVLGVLADLRAAGCDMLALGQYLRPSKRQLPVGRYLEPAEFEDYREKALGMGFRFVQAGPLVRSSFKAREGWESYEGV